MNKSRPEVTSVPTDFSGGPRASGSRSTRIGTIVRLGHNERTIPLPETAVREMLELIRPEDLTALPELGPLYEKMSRHFEVTTDQLIICHGSDAGIGDLFRAFVGAGDQVVQPHPTYHRYIEFCEIAGAEPVLVGYDPTDYHFRCADVHESIRPGTKLVVIVNPGSPTGLPVTIECIDRVATQARRHGALILVDEAYHHYCDVSAIPLLSKHPNLVVARTFSKAWGIAGLRVGAILSDSAVIAGLRKIKPRHEISSVSARITEYLLDHPSIMREYVLEVERARPLVAETLRGLGYAAIPGSSASMLVRVPDFINPNSLKEALASEGYEVAAGLPEPFQQHMRVGIGPWVQMEGFLSALADVTRRLDDHDQHDVKPAAVVQPE